MLVCLMVKPEPGTRGSQNAERVLTLRELLRLPMSVVCSNVPSRGTARLLRPGGPPAWRTDIDTHKTTKGGLQRRDPWCSQKCPPHKVGLLACIPCARHLGLSAPLSARVWVGCSASPTCMRSAPLLLLWAMGGHLPARAMGSAPRRGPRGSRVWPLLVGHSRATSSMRLRAART